MLIFLGFAGTMNLAALRDNTECYRRAHPQTSPKRTLMPPATGSTSNRSAINVPKSHIEGRTPCKPGTFDHGHPEGAFRFAYGPYHPDAERAFEIHRQRAQEMGQVWSKTHAEAFRELHQAYVLTAMGLSQGRTAWPFAVGTGKTQSLVTFALAQSEAARAGRETLSLLICIERVDQGRDLYNEMIHAGVPAHMVGVYHRKTPREVAQEKLIPSVSDADVDKVQFLIATHAMMLKGEDFIAKVNTYNAAERHLVVWDESLIKSQGRHFDLRAIDGAAGVLRAFVSDTTSDSFRDARDAVEYVSRCVDLLRMDFLHSAEGNEPRVSELPQLTPEDETRFHVGIVDALGGNDAMRRDSRLKLVEFIEHVQRPVRVVPYVESGQRVGVVHYLTRIPESLSRLIVLDASHTIRRLTSEHDSTLRETPVNCRVKSFDVVSVRHIIQGAGRDSLDKALPKKDSQTSTRLISLLGEYAPTEGIIIVTFKPDARDERLGKSHADHLKRHMKRAGIDPESKLADGRPRFVFLTWGQHIGVSKYAYCQHVLCIGVLRRDVLDIASNIVGQRTDLLAREAADPAEVRRVIRSEMFHNVIQAAGRGSCRTTKDGAAGAMTLTLLCVETFPPEWWQEAMPGVVVTEEKPNAQARALRQSDSERAIHAALEALPLNQERVSTRVLKSLAGLQSLRPNRYSELLKHLHIPNWRRDGQSLYRCLFVDESAT